MQWEVVRGVHSDKTFTPVSLAKVGGIERTEGDGTYYRGDVIETEKDLSRHGSFKPLGQFVAAQAPELDDNIAAMSVAELKAYAAAEEIDLGEATLKADIAAVIRRSLVNGLVPAGV